ncbi:MAG: SAM-dependent chlorinase/fluorinase [Erysipelotrichaceae bacterium]|nr:SAM-dependent chlorinase/fluorinase [Erysipelotrichaceae bacterium]
MEKSMLVFQTDFTYKEGAVCAMYGVVKSVDRDLEIIDGSHELPQYDTWSASYRLYQSMKFWPKGTIFVSVVDPGVGTKRRACVAKTKDGYFIVTPDNGALTHVKKEVGIETVREIDEDINRLKGKDTEGVAIFHGRDLFGYCAARLASGIITYEEVGPEYSIDEIVCHKIIEPTIENKVIKGIFEINDPNFGNLWTNIKTSMFFENGFNYGDDILVKIYNDDLLIYNKIVKFDKSFGMVNKGEDIIYNNELMKIAMATSMGSFVNKNSLGFGHNWKVEFSHNE